MNELQENCDTTRDRIIAALEEQISVLKEIIAKAKDITPVIKPSFSRVKRMAEAACLELKKVGKHFVVSMGSTSRTFKKLREIWEFLCQEDWNLSDLFPQLDPDKKEEKPTGKPCKYCNLPILWVPSDWGKWLPIDAITHKRHRCQQYDERSYYSS
jgi:hypothetical protein